MERRLTMPQVGSLNCLAEGAVGSDHAAGSTVARRAMEALNFMLLVG